MSKTQIRLRPINRLSKYNEYFDILAKTDKESGAERTFSTIKDAMIFCAFLGFELEKRTPLPMDENKSDIQEHVFTNDNQALSSVFILGLAEKKDWSILHPDQMSELVTVFEEYANTGIQKLAEWLEEDVHDLDAVETIISKLKVLGHEAVIESQAEITPVKSVIF